jgi:hypothetical protein
MNRNINEQKNKVLKLENLEQGMIESLATTITELQKVTGKYKSQRILLKK